MDLEKDKSDASITAIDITEKKEIIDMLTTLLEKCKKECDNHELEIPLHNYAERVSFYTGYTISVIKDLIENKENSITKICSTIHPSDRVNIYKTVKKLYAQNIFPTFEDVYEGIKTQIDIATLAGFEHEMRLMGYDYRNIQNSKVLMEDPNITFKRFFYLDKMRKETMKNSRRIYYIDERLVDFSLSFTKVCMKNVDVSTPLMDGYVFLYIICKNIGYVTGLFCNPFTANDLKKWITDMVIGLLDPGSVVIINDNPLFNDNNGKPFSKYDTKEKMFMWLKENNIPCNVQMRKAELYELIRRCPKQVKKCGIGKILEAHGHEVLRLPLHLHDFTPTEQLWKHIGVTLKSEEESTSVDSKDLNTLTDRILKSIAKISQGHWNNLETEASERENELYEIDSVTECHLNELLQNIKLNERKM